jgi:hypothetical protein
MCSFGYLARSRVIRTGLIAAIFAAAVSIATVTAAHAAPAAPAVSCSYTYDQLETNSGWRYEQTDYGDIAERVIMFGVFDTMTHSLCGAYSEYQVNIQQYLGQCAFTVNWDMFDPYDYASGSFQTTACWYTYTRYSPTAVDILPGQCYYADVVTNYPYTSGQQGGWCV